MLENKLYVQSVSPELMITCGATLGVLTGRGDGNAPHAEIPDQLHPATRTCGARLAAEEYQLACVTNEDGYPRTHPSSY